MRTTPGIICLAATLATGCNKPHDAVERPTPVEVQAVQTLNSNPVKRFSAVVEPYEQVDLSFRVGGYVDSIAQTAGIDHHPRAIQDGDLVMKGGVLARLHASDYSARVQEAKASIAEAETLLAKAQLDQRRASNLFAAQSLTKPELDLANSNFEAGQARLASAHGRLQEATTASGDTILRAPFSGVILKRNISQGSLAAPGSPAFAMADISSVKAVFGVPDKLVPKMKIGAPLSLKVDMLPDSEFHGRISRVSAAADPKSRIFEVEVSIPNQKSELKIGMVATLMVQEDVAQTMDPAVPISALVRSTIHPGGYAVFIASNEGGASRARLRDVEVGTTIGNFIAIKSGTTPGEQIITSGAGLLRDGEPVEIVSGNATLTAKR